MSKKLFFFFIFLSIIKISFQVDCDDFSDLTCGDHNTKYNLKCLKFNSGTKCSEIEYDDGCTMTAEKKCQKTDDKGSYQCYFYEDNYKYKCERINVDDYCEINESNKLTKECKAKSSPALEANHKCKLINNEKECKSQPFECSEYSTSSCSSHGNTCFKVNFYSSQQCRIVTVDSKCQIDDSGDCKDKTNAGPASYQKCEYNSLYNECKPINKKCSEMDASKCSDLQLTESGNYCKKIGGVCQEVQIDSSCVVDDNGECKKPSGTNNNNICQFNSDKSKCLFYEVNAQCKLTASGSYVSCGDGDTLADKDNNKCASTIETETKTVCKPRAKYCSEYNSNSASCEGVKSGTKKCSWYNSYCQEYTVDNYCTVERGECKKADGADLGNQLCLFDIERKSCTRKPNICENYYDNCGTSSYSNTTHQCVQLDLNDYCKPIEIDNFCKVDANYECKPKNSIADTEICSYNDPTDIKSCTKRTKVCKDYSSSECNSKQNCYSPGYSCYGTETDSNCIVQDGQCKANNVDLGDYHKCSFVYKDQNTFKCEKTIKNCRELDSTKCNNAPENGGAKCYYYSGNCRTLYSDGNCTMNEGECSEIGTGKVSTNEKCVYYLDDNNLYCAKREKLCSDLDSNECDKYTPEMKFCFYVSSKGCTEIKVDSQCSVNDKIVCTGDNCQFDNDKGRCYYQEKSNGSLLKMEQFILLMLFFML